MTITELLESVRRVEVRTNRLVNDTMVGAYLSHFKGRGMDFEELREYIPGDEVRDIDWNVTYRMGRPFVKRYREERELAMVLAVDVSASSAFGSLRRTKRQFAAEIAGTLAISATRSSDKVGAAAVHRPGRAVPAAAQGPAPYSAAHPRDALLRAQAPRHQHPGGPGFPESRAAPALDRVPAHRLSAQLRPHRHPTGAGRDTLQEIGLTNARHDLVCVHLHDPRESTLPPAGLLTIEDAETGELLEVDSSRAAVRERFADTNAERLAELDRAFRRAGVDTLRFSTAETFAQTLQAFFETRRGRRRG